MGSCRGLPCNSPLATPELGCDACRLDLKSLAIWASKVPGHLDLRTPRPSTGVSQAFGPEVFQECPLSVSGFLRAPGSGVSKTRECPRSVCQRIAKGAGKEVPRENCRKVSKNFLTLFDDF